MADVAACKK